MNSTEDNLYFIAILFPGYVNEEINEHKQVMAFQYGSKEALNVMPHFTLKAPMRFPAYMHEMLLDWFQSMTITVSAFQQEINGFGAFHNKYNPVIYAQPANVFYLKRLQKEIIYHFRNSPLMKRLHPLDIKFTPHATVAYRDLSVPAFKQAWQEYRTKEYYTAFDITSFHLLQHNRKFWQSISEYHLPPNDFLIEELQLSPLNRPPKPLASKALTLF